MYYSDLKNAYRRIYTVSPNDLGNHALTGFYKLLTKPVKTMPFLYLAPLSLIGSLILYLLLGRFVIKLVNLLQYGF